MMLVVEELSDGDTAFDREHVAWHVVSPSGEYVEGDWAPLLCAPGEGINLPGRVRDGLPSCYECLQDIAQYEARCVECDGILNRQFPRALTCGCRTGMGMHDGRS